MKYPAHLINLIESLKKLPGVGNKSAERFAFQLLTWPQEQLHKFSEIVKEIPEKIKNCDRCGCLTGSENCQFCDSTHRDTSIICVIASPRDAFSIEETREYKGLYHTLGGLLSPMDNFGPERLGLQKLKSRIEMLNSQELVIALDSTLEGDATSLFIKQEFASLNLQISRLAFGLPMGSSIDFVDGGTLARAFSGRRTY